MALSWISRPQMMLLGGAGCVHVGLVVTPLGYVQSSHLDV